MIYIVDRIEDDIAVLENKDTKEIINIPKKDLPKIKEGSVLKYENDKYTIDKEEEEKRKKAVLEKFNKLRKKDIH
jgi:hypothetical protein